MRLLGTAAAIATIIAAIFTVASYYQDKSPKTNKVQTSDNRLLRPSEQNRNSSSQSAQINGTEKNTFQITILEFEELKALHKIAQKISNYHTRDGELKKLANLAMKNGYLEYAIGIAEDISNYNTEDQTLKSIALYSSQQGQRAIAVKAAENISNYSTKNDVLKSILGSVESE